MTEHLVIITAIGTV